MSYEGIRTRVDQSVAFIVIDRPPYNAFIPETVVEIRHAIAAFDDDPVIRCIVIGSAGKHFATGADLKSGGYMDASNGRIDRNRIAAAKDMALARYPDGCRSLLRCRTPIVAAMSGAAVGAGLCLALQADLRIVAHDARFVMGFAKRGLTPEMGVSWLLPRLVGYGRAAELLLTGREISGDRAVEIGLAVSAVDAGDVAAAAAELAGDIARDSSPTAVALTKQLLWGGAEQPSLERAAEVEAVVNAWMGRHADIKEGFTSFLEKRPPDFADAVAAEWPLVPGALPNLPRHFM